LLVDIGREALAAGARRVVEIGTGSGAIAISLAAETGSMVLATEVSWAALSLARENATLLGQTERVRFVQTDLLAGLRGPFDVVLANLPYVPSGRVLPPDVADYEPPVAIFGGPGGTELVERVLRQADVTRELALELDESDQARPLAALARHLFPRAEITIRQDGGGYDRVLHLRHRDA
jgi:release factor glutamine methyltransferase